MPVLIRPLLKTDFDNAEEILSSAFQRAGGWHADLRIFHSLEPDGLFLAERDAIPAGMVAAMLYPAFAYVGMMAIHSRYQHQGIGLGLMQNLLAWLERQQVARVVLDASPAGQPLYEHLGFQSYDTVQVFQRTGEPIPFTLPPRLRWVHARYLDRLTAFDAQVFGTDRGRLLRALWKTHPGRAFLLKDERGGMRGYIFAQENRIGPWVACNEEDAAALLKAAVSLSFTGTVSVAVPGENPKAAALLQQCGFEPGRLNRHMARGGNLPDGRRDQVYAQASLSLG